MVNHAQIRRRDAACHVSTVSEHSEKDSEPSAVLSEHSETLAEPSAALSEHSETLAEPSAALSEHSETPAEPSAVLSEHPATFAEGSAGDDGGFRRPQQPRNHHCDRISSLARICNPCVPADVPLARICNPCV
ncbi:MAG: hypothetical protein LBR10_12825 [Prevotellaceae bacterium]|jgi:hypothetical protein|nr:hypothetical protein [Prevotellaceae bacterium]